MKVLLRLLKGGVLPVVALGGFLLALLLPLAVGKYWSFLAAQTLAYAIALTGLMIVVGLLGQPSLMHAELMGFGAAVTATLVEVKGWNFWVAGAVAVAVAFVTGVVVGLPALRIRGLALAIVTLAIGRLFDQLVLPSQLLSGGVGGRSISRPSLGPISLEADQLYYEVALAAFVAVVFLAVSIRRGKLGRIFRAIKGSERGAAASGVSLTRYKLLGFAFSTALAALGGVVGVGASGSFTPAPYDWVHSITFLAMLVIMGADSLTGAVLASVVMIDMVPLFQGAGGVFQTLSKFFEQSIQLFSGVLLIGVLVLAPKGLVPGAASFLRRRLVLATPSRAPAPVAEEEAKPVGVGRK